MGFQEERELFSDNFKIYLKEIASLPILTEYDKKKLQPLIQTSLEARNRMIEGHLKLVVAIALNFFNARNHLKEGLSIMDLVQAGNEGLVYATKTYDIKRNSSFTTCAYYWIRQHIYWYICKNSRTIRVPENVLKELSKYKQTVEQLEFKLNRPPSFKEIAEEMHISENRAKQLFFYLDDAISFDSTIQGDDEEFSSFIGSSQLTVEEIILKKEAVQLIRSRLNKLTNKQRCVVSKYYGFNNGEPKKFYEIAKEMKTTYQAAQQLHTTAIKRLRRPKNIKPLVDYFKV